MNFFTAPFRILAVAGVCIIALIVLVVNETRARDAGVEVILAMQPVDPRALLSGHYVIVSLQEQLPAGEACPATLTGDAAASRMWNGNAPLAGWVALSPRDEVHTVSGYADTREGAAELGPIVARGEASCTTPPTEAAPTPEPAAEGGKPGTAAPPEPPAPPAGRANLTADLGVDRFYIDQTNAERIDRMMRDNVGAEEAQVFAILSIGSDGRARMKGLIVDGERLELSLN